MIIPDPKRYTHSDENLLPMINIIFLLLIFFMVAGVITASDQLNLTPIQSKAGTETELDQTALLLSADGRMILAGVESSLNIDPVTLQHSLTDGYQQWRQIVADADDDTPLPVKMDAAVTSAQLAKLMRMLEAANVKTIHIVTKSAE